MTITTWLCSTRIGVALGLVVSCTGPTNPVKPPPSSPEKPAAVAGASHWAYLPIEPARLRARQELGDAVLLFAGDKGERWLVDARRGSARAAAHLADENLVGIARPEPGLFVFVGDKGTLYRTSSPLGPFDDVLRVEPSPQQVVAAGPFVLALQWDGVLRRSEDGGRSFERANLAAERPFELALAPDGRVMLASYPEQLWLSSDAGRSWRDAGLPTMGVGSVGMDARGSLVAGGVWQSVIWRAGSEVVVTDRPFERPSLDLLTDLGPAPGAAAIVEGRGRITESGYAEVGRDGSEGPWWISVGRMDERLVRLPIVQSEDCRQMAVGMRGRLVALGCMSAPRRGGVLFPRLRVLVSRDGGLTFTSGATGLVADEVGTHIHVLPDATLLLTGVCKPNDEGICSPAVPVRLGQTTSESSSVRFGDIEVSETPAVLGRVGPVVASPSGARLYATALLASGRQHAVLVSDDAGRSFRAVRLDLHNMDALRPKQVGEQQWLASIQPGELRVGSDGALSLVMLTIGGPAWLLLDSSARLVSAHAVPKEQKHLVAVGRRGIAFGDQYGSVMESADGGRSFRKAARLALATLVVEGVPRVACGLAGCVFGEAFVRAGWGAAPGGIVERDRDVDGRQRGDRTPIVCDVHEGPAGKLQGVLEEVTAARAAQGPHAWTAVMVDRTKAAAWVAHATSDPQPRVDLVPLLPPVPQGAGYAFEARPQAEGAAALRYRVPRGAQGSPKAGAQMTRIEVAWDNAFEGPPRRALIPTAGVVRDDDVSSARPDEAAVARSRVLSVSVGGIFVCPHARCDGASTSLLFLDGNGGLRTVQGPTWQGAAGLNTELSSHMIRTGLGDVPIAFTGGLPVVLRARARDDTGYDYAALGLLPWDAEQRGWHERLTWAFGPPDALALAFTAWHEDGAAAFARILHLNVDKGVASTSPAPTQSDLPDPPVACPQTLRHSSMRIVGPAQPRTRHPVLVRFRDGSGLNLRTDQAVLHGTPEQPCAAVLDAAGASGPYRALIPLDDLEHAWLFEKIGADQLGWKTMTCRFEAGASLDAPAPAPTPAIGPTGTGRRPATQQECDEIFTTMVRTALGGRTQPPATGPFDAMRTSFRDRCLGRPVDIDCVRRATLPEQVQRCIDLASK